VGCRSTEPRSASLCPHLLYLACATGTHQPCVAEHPRSGRGQEVRVGRWTNSVEIYSYIEVSSRLCGLVEPSRSGEDGRADEMDGQAAVKGRALIWRAREVVQRAWIGVEEGLVGRVGLLRCQSWKRGGEHRCVWGDRRARPASVNGGGDDH
jgi:hypothetical protein